MEKQPFTIASVTEILVDDGQPLSVMFGGGVGVEFIRHPYAEWVKEGIEEPYIIKFYNYTKKVFTELSSPDNQRELDRIINSTCGNLMKRLSDENLNLTERDLQILRIS